MPEQQNPEHQLEYLKELRAKYEEALSNAQKSGDYTEAKKLKEELDKRLSALEALFSKPEAEENNIEIKEKGETPYEKAKEIMGEDFFGLEAFANTFINTRTLIPEFQRIPYSIAELEQAKERGEMLILRYSLSWSSTSVMKDIHKRLLQVIKDSGRNVLYNTTSYQDQNFYVNEPIREGWSIVSRNVIAGSVDKNYIEQTRLLRDNLIKLGTLIPDEVFEVTDTKLDEIRELMEIDWKAAATRLSELKINQNHRRTLAEALYDFGILYRNTPDKERMLEKIYDWTNTLGFDGKLFFFGGTHAEDPADCNIDWQGPGIGHANLGVVSVR